MNKAIECIDINGKIFILESEKTYETNRFFWKKEDVNKIFAVKNIEVMSTDFVFENNNLQRKITYSCVSKEIEVISNAILLNPIVEIYQKELEKITTQLRDVKNKYSSNGPDSADLIGRLIFLKDQLTDDINISIEFAGEKIKPNISNNEIIRQFDVCEKHIETASKIVGLIKNRFVKVTMHDWGIEITPIFNAMARSKSINEFVTILQEETKLNAIASDTLSVLTDPDAFSDFNKARMLMGLTPFK